MNIKDKVYLKNDMDSLHMFPEKYTIPDSKTIKAGAIGEIEELFPSGSGIINFNGHRILMTNIESKVIYNG